MQTIAKAQSTMTDINTQLAEVEKLCYSNDPRAPAALQSLAVKLNTADHELTAFEKLMGQADADESASIRFSINLPQSRRTN